MRSRISLGPDYGFAVHRAYLLTIRGPCLDFFFFLNDPPPTEFYPLPLHAPLPISRRGRRDRQSRRGSPAARSARARADCARDRLRGAGLPSIIFFFLLFTPLPARADLYRWIEDRKSTRLNSSHSQISYAVFCLKKK